MIYSIDFETRSRANLPDVGLDIYANDPSTLSNADMKMAGVAKGLTKDAPAASNLIFAVLNRENEQMLLERGKAWTAYQQQMRNAGYQPDFNRFRETEAYTKAMDAKEARIAKRFPEFFKTGTQATTGEQKALSPADFMRGTAQ